MAHPLCSSKLRMDPTPAWQAFCEAPMACVPNLDPNTGALWEQNHQGAHQALTIGQS